MIRSAISSRPPRRRSRFSVDAGDFSSTAAAFTAWPSAFTTTLLRRRRPAGAAAGCSSGPAGREVRVVGHATAGSQESAGLIRGETGTRQGCSVGVGAGPASAVPTCRALQLDRQHRVQGAQSNVQPIVRQAGRQGGKPAAAAAGALSGGLGGPPVVSLGSLLHGVKPEGDFSVLYQQKITSRTLPPSLCCCCWSAGAVPAHLPACHCRAAATLLLPMLPCCESRCTFSLTEAAECVTGFKGT